MLSFVASCSGQWDGVVNHGLVGAGRLSADLFDQMGPGVDTLGGVFSAMSAEEGSWSRTNLADGQALFRGRLLALPDRGFGDGSSDYHPRIQTFQVEIRPYLGAGPVGQTQISLTNIKTLVLTYQGKPFTGYDAGDPQAHELPTSSQTGPGGGRPSLDPEGLVRAPEGGFYVSDEYGPFIYHFNARGEWLSVLRPPEALIPKRGGFPGMNAYTATNAPDQGRRNNRGFECLTLTPDSRQLIAALQSPTVQDGGLTYLSRNTRVVAFDIDRHSPSYGRPIHEYVFPLTLSGSAQTNRHTPISEVLAIGRDRFLFLERDSLGKGAATNLPPIHKRVVLATTHGASDLIHTDYDLEKGHPKHKSLPPDRSPSNLHPMPRKEFIDLLDARELARFGLNTHSDWDENTVPEKWEGLALVPWMDPGAPDDFLLLIGSDNDFKASTVYHNGKVVGTNEVAVDTLILAYRVTLPGLRLAPGR